MRLTLSAPAPSTALGHAGTAALDVDSHTQQCVDEAHAVGTGAFDGLGYIGDAGDVGRELHYQCLVVHLAYRGDDLCRHVGAGAEAHASALDVGAADVELDGGDAVEGVDLRGHVAVLLDGRAADVDYDIGVEVFDTGVYLFAELLHTAVLEAHGVEHTRGGLHHAGVGVALAVGAGGALDDEAAEAVEVYEVGELFAVAEGAAGGHHGVLQREVMDFDC